MPVFTRIRDGVLVVTVDGDYTPDELSRVGERAFASDDVSIPVAVLLDMSGAAGVEKKSPDDLRRTGEFFGERQDIMTCVAVLTPSRVAHGLMDSGGSLRRLDWDSKSTLPRPRTRDSMAERRRLGRSLE